MEGGKEVFRGIYRVDHPHSQIPDAAACDLGPGIGGGHQQENDHGNHHGDHMGPKKAKGIFLSAAQDQHNGSSPIHECPHIDQHCPGKKRNGQVPGSLKIVVMHANQKQLGPLKGDGLQQQGTEQRQHRVVRNQPKHPAGDFISHARPLHVCCKCGCR